MNHTDSIKYIKNLLFKMYNKSTQLMKPNIADNFNNKNKLRNPALHEICLINSIEKLNKLISLEFVDIMNITEDNYMLTLDNTYFNETILIDKNERILPIRLMKSNEIINMETSKMNILDINKNSFCGYILHEIINSNIQ